MAISTLPIFPLSLVVFPKEHLNLHVFEPKYKQLVNDCLTGGTNFAVIPYINGKLCSLGTELEIFAVERVYPNGEMDIKTEGIKLFRSTKVISALEGKLYAAVEPDWINDVADGDDLIKQEVIELLYSLHETLKIDKELFATPADFSTYDVAHMVGFSLEQEYQLLSLRSEKKRQIMMLEHLKHITPIAKETERLKERIMANGHFKNIIPPEV